MNLMQHIDLLQCPLPRQQHLLDAAHAALIPIDLCLRNCKCHLLCMIKPLHKLKYLQSTAFPAMTLMLGSQGLPLPGLSSRSLTRIMITKRCLKARMSRLTVSILPSCAGTISYFIVIMAALCNRGAIIFFPHNLNVS